MTQLAQKVKPPNLEEMRKADPATSLAGVFGLVVAALAGYGIYQLRGLLWAAATFFGVFFAAVMIGGSYSEVDSQFRKRRAAWDRKYMCMKCGATALQPYKEYQASIKRSSDDPELDRLIRANQILQAVKHVRDHQGLGLAEAHALVKARADLLS